MEHSFAEEDKVERQFGRARAQMEVEHSAICYRCRLIVLDMAFGDEVYPPLADYIRDNRPEWNERPERFHAPLEQERKRKKTRKDRQPRDSLSPPKRFG